MSKSPSRIRTRAHAEFKRRVEKLQKAGLLGEVDTRKKPSPATLRAMDKYKSVISGKATALELPDTATAQKMRKSLGLKGRGKTVVIPKEKGERYKYRKSTGELVSTRKGYNEGERIEKTLGTKFPVKPETGSGEKTYYTIPERVRGRGRIKRTTFGTFDEMLYYLSRYDIRWEDIEDRLEVETVKTGSRKHKVMTRQIHDEREAAIKRKKRRTRAQVQKSAARAKRRSRK